MEPKKVQKANRIIYIVVIVALCATALVVGITSAANRGKPGTTPPAATTSPVTTAAPATTAPLTTAPPAPIDLPLPEFLAPAIGNVAKAHEVTVPVYSLTTNDYRTHTGIDIACEVGEKVYAAASGVVEMIASDPMMGNTVTISHNGGGVTIYKNLAEEMAEGIKVGATVTAGQHIAYVGESAMIESADEPHLHFEMTVKGASVDPLDYIKEESKSASLSKDETFEG